MSSLFERKKHLLEQIELSKKSREGSINGDKNERFTPKRDGRSN